MEDNFTVRFLMEHIAFISETVFCWVHLINMLLILNNHQYSRICVIISLILAIVSLLPSLYIIWNRLPTLYDLKKYCNKHKHQGKN